MLLLTASFEPIFEPIMGVAARYNGSRDELAAENQREDERRRATRNEPAMGLSSLQLCTNFGVHELCLARTFDVRLCANCRRGLTNVIPRSNAGNNPAKRFTREE
jgi:hypothetical protein